MNPVTSAAEVFPARASTRRTSRADRRRLRDHRIRGSSRIETARRSRTPRSFVLLGVAMLAIGLDIGVARITYGIALPAFARDLQLSLTAAGLLGTLHLIRYLLGTLASPSLNAIVAGLQP